MAEQELTYERAFPGRFLKAALFDGKIVTVTIEQAFLEVLEGDKGKEQKLILSFVGKTMQLVCNKTNALCLKEMWGSKVSMWVGKHVAFYPTIVSFGPKRVDAIRVYGSPDIDADIEVVARIGRKNFKATMHKTGPATASHEPQQQPETQETAQYDEKFNLLGWAPQERADFLASMKDATEDDIHARLDTYLDEP